MLKVGHREAKGWCWAIACNGIGGGGDGGSVGCEEKVKVKPNAETRKPSFAGLMHPFDFAYLKLMLRIQPRVYLHPSTSQTTEHLRKQPCCVSNLNDFG